jgi:hypothetical protein
MINSGDDTTKLNTKGGVECIMLQRWNDLKDTTMKSIAAEKRDKPSKTTPKEPSPIFFPTL